MNTPARITRDQSGLVGKMIVVWLLIVAVLGVAAIDTASIAFTKFRLSDITSNAASDAANAFRSGHDKSAACDAATASVAQANSAAQIPTKGGCMVNAQTGAVTVTVRIVAPTLVAKRVSFLKKYGEVSDTETNGPTAL